MASREGYIKYNYTQFVLEKIGLIRGVASGEGVHICRGANVLLFVYVQNARVRPIFPYTTHATRLHIMTTLVDNHRMVITYLRISGGLMSLMASCKQYLVIMQHVGVSFLL